MKYIVVADGLVLSGFSIASLCKIRDGHKSVFKTVAKGTYSEMYTLANELNGDDA